jgi:DNA-binding transcriptional MerR regulator/effector-binding domain-containing protein
MGEEAGGRRALYSIGPFSRVTGLTVKTVRLYHEKGLLPPSLVDRGSGYRYFTESDVERARLIARLRQLEFPLSEIKQLLDEHADAGGTLPFLEGQRRRIEERRAQLGGVRRQLDRMIAHEREALERARALQHPIEDRSLEPILVAIVRWSGSYDESGKAVGRVLRRFGRLAAGSPFNLYYDLEYKDGDADVASGVPLRQQGRASAAAPPFAVLTLPAVRALCLRHRGPYAEIDRSYARVLAEVQARGLQPTAPSREIFLKGPGLLFRGNPRDYLTEIQVPVSTAG